MYVFVYNIIRSFAIFINTRRFWIIFCSLLCLPETGHGGRIVTKCKRKRWRKKEDKKMGYKRKIGRHTRSVVLLFWLKFLIAFSTYCPAFFREFAIVAVTIELKKDGTEKSKHGIQHKRKFSLPLVRRNIYRRRFETWIREVKFVPKENGGRYCSCEWILQRLCSSLLIRWQILTIEGKLIIRSTREIPKGCNVKYYTVQYGDILKKGIKCKIIKNTVTYHFKSRYFCPILNLFTNLFYLAKRRFDVFSLFCHSRKC